MGDLESERTKEEIPEQHCMMSIGCAILSKNNERIFEDHL